MITWKEANFAAIGLAIGANAALYYASTVIHEKAASQTIVYENRSNVAMDIAVQGVRHVFEPGEKVVLSAATGQRIE